MANVRVGTPSFYVQKIQIRQQKQVSDQRSVVLSTGVWRAQKEKNYYTQTKNAAFIIFFFLPGTTLVNHIYNYVYYVNTNKLDSHSLRYIK